MFFSIGNSINFSCHVKVQFNFENKMGTAEMTVPDCAQNVPVKVKY